MPCACVANWGCALYGQCTDVVIHSNMDARYGFPDESGTLLLSDNQSSIKVAKNSVFHKRSKHIAIRFHFIRENVESGKMSLEFIRTLAMAADQLNK